MLQVLGGQKLCKAVKQGAEPANIVEAARSHTQPGQDLCWQTRPRPLHTVVRPLSRLAKDEIRRAVGHPMASRSASYRREHEKGVGFPPLLVKNRLQQAPS